MRIVAAGEAHLAGWSTLRAALWPDDPPAEHRHAIMAALDDTDAAGFVAETAEGAVVGFVEAVVRHDYVNGCDTAPVAFVEGLYVAPDHRRAGVAAALLAAVEGWSCGRGLAELASDALLDNAASHAFHRATGFDETERVVFFRKLLQAPEPR